MGSILGFRQGGSRPPSYTHAVSDDASWASTPGVRRSMRANRGRDTSPELAIRRELHRRGRRYFVNRRPVPTIRRTSDILFPRKKVAVLIDGCFWHGCPLHRTWPKTNSEFWLSKIEANIARDTETTRLWEEAGWGVLRFWEHQPVDEVVAEIEARLSE